MIGRHASGLLLLASVFILCDYTVEGLPDWITSDMLEMIADDKARCMAEHGTTQELIEKVDGGDITNDRSITCYMNCLFETFGVVDEDTGDFEAEMLIGFLPEDIQKIGREHLLPCADEKGSDRCDTVYKIALCIYSKRPDVSIEQLGS